MSDFLIGMWFGIALTWACIFVSRAIEAAHGIKGEA